jgi:hypothetical protein
VHAKDIKCPLERWRKHETMFPIVGFLERRIVGSQIEMEIIFSLVRTLNNLKKCCLQSNNLKFLIFVSKSWPNDATMGCKTPIKLIDFELGLEQELDEFESSFE